MDHVQVWCKKKYRLECVLVGLGVPLEPVARDDYERQLGFLWNSDLIVGYRTIPVADAITFSLNGVPNRGTADAMSGTGDPRDVNFIIQSYEAAKRAAEARNNKGV